MAAVAVDSWQRPPTFQSPPTQQSRPHFQYAQPQMAPPEEQIPPRNERDLNRDMLIMVLTYFSTLLPSRFNGLPVRLVVHGGACMLLHPKLYELAQQQQSQKWSSPTNSPHRSLPHRESTRDVDYINRSFAAEWQHIGIMDATERLQDCIKATARQFHLGADWMNSDADIALPMANDPSGKTYDPIYAASIQPNNVHLHTIFTSPNMMLSLVSVTPFWAVALKLVRYTKWDPGDICLLLRNGTKLSGTQWSSQTLEAWLHQYCWPMNYGSWDSRKILDMKSRIKHAIEMVSSLGGATDDETKRVTTDAAMGASTTAPDAVSQWTNSNPGFIPPPPITTQHDPPRWMDPPNNAPQYARGPTPEFDDWNINPLARPKSSRPNHQRHESHAEQFGRSVAAMIQASHPKPTTALLNGDEPAVIPHRQRKKMRDTNRKRDRFSKWLMARHSDESGSDDSDTDDRQQAHHSHSQSHGQHLRQHEQFYQLQQQQQQQHKSHPPAWHIYAPPKPTQLAPIDLNSRRRDPSPSSHGRKPSRHRPPPLDIDHLQQLPNSLGLY